jgi:hypothetical protein
MVEIITGTALWNNPGRRVPIRYVLVRDPMGELEPQAFLCTDLDAAPLDILRWFVRRWSIEVTFAEVRRHLGVETRIAACCLDCRPAGVSHVAAFDAHEACDLMGKRVLPRMHAAIVLGDGCLKDAEAAFGGSARDKRSEIGPQRLR